MFRKYDIDIHESELRAIFSSLDIDNRDTIPWDIFLSDFNKNIKLSLSELEEEEDALHRGFDDELDIRDGGAGITYQKVQASGSQ
jgi:Ca2+-binding EF-hand superfamily protein